MNDKVRVYVLARELNMESKDLLDMCKAAGMDIKNQLSSLDAEQVTAIRDLVKKKPATPVPPPIAPSIPNLDKLGKVRTIAAPSPGPATSPPLSAAAASATSTGLSESLVPPAVTTPAAAAEPATPPILTPTATNASPAPGSAASGSSRVSNIISKMRDLNQSRPKPQTGSEPPKPPVKPEPPKRPVAYSPVVAAPPKPRTPVPQKKEEKPPQPPAQKPLARLTPDLLGKGSGSLTEKDVKEIVRKVTDRAKLGQTGIEGTVVPPVEDEDEDVKSGKRPGAIKGREERHRRRSLKKERPETDLRRGLTDDEPEVRTLSRVKERIRQKQQRGTQPRKGKVPIEPPISVRSLSEALGVRANDLLRKLVELGQMVNINAVIDDKTAELLALDYGAELDIKRELDPEEELLQALIGEDRPEDLVPRAPIVTVMGHVDHGKTSLLDRIRESNVVDTEAGGITQHLRAWRVEHNGKPITFLDTPGHEAFTQMRARGAQVTDIVVLVVAADDGVMPQTEEAISHAKAAGVPIVVAINKVDLPNANLNKTRQQLYGHGLIPDTMGGDTPFVETVSAPGKARGINDLLDMLALVAELKELKANPRRPARGTCLEAKLTEGEGVVATLLVQDGTLHRGDVVVCGQSFGRVRAMYDDQNRPIDEAGPSWPVRITGLDLVPNADDKFQVLPDLALSRQIAETRRDRQRSAQPARRATFRLEDLDKAEVEEIKVILKADVRGSIEAIKKELEKLQHEEVRIQVLHSGIGGITEGDVQLALASPEDTMIVGFNVVPDDRAKALADEKGVQIRQYDIIYKLTEDLRAALEGKLKPIEEVIHLGRAVVREIFKISRVGTVAGCAVTQGVIERSARVRVIRDGVVVYPPPDRTATLESLRRVKDDVREVREGYECGIKIANFDDVKVGDVIEAYRVEQVQRTL